MNEIQEKKVEKVKDDWTKSGCIYQDIVERSGIVYMVLGNGTALTIDEDGRLDWVVKGWD